MDFLKIDADILHNQLLTSNEKLILALLRDKQNLYKDKVFYCYEEYIAKFLNISVKTVSRAIQNLIRLKEIDVYKEYNQETKKNNNLFKVY